MMKTKGNFDNNKIGHFLGLFADLSAVHVFNNQIKCFIAMSKAEIKGQHWISIEPIRFIRNSFELSNVWGFDRPRSGFESIKNFSAVPIRYDSIGFYYIMTDSINSFVFKNVSCGFLGMLNATIWKEKRNGAWHIRMWARTVSHENNTHADKLENVNSHTCPIINYYSYYSIRCRLLSSCPNYCYLTFWNFFFGE